MNATTDPLFWVMASLAISALTIIIIMAFHKPKNKTDDK